MDKAQTEHFRYLFSRYVNRLSTEAEYEAFLELIGQSEHDAELRDLLEQLWEELDDQQQNQRYPFLKRWTTYATAASVLLALALGYYLLRFKAATTNNHIAEQINPVQQGISLRLANGKTIRLQKAYSGSISGTSARQQDSLISYQSGQQNGQLAEEKNTLTNNGSSKFAVTLADGSEAILDIGSSLTYPVAFNKEVREVTLTGQGYFKVKHQNARFLVHYGNETTEDIGTVFNISAYPNENATTTLVEGSIKVNDVLLKPGQQSENNKIGPADLEANLAWLQDKYIFNNEPLEHLMTWVSRNYGVRVVYQDEKLKQITYGGAFNRKKKLASVLDFLRKVGGVDFKVENQTVTVFKSKN